MQWIKKGIKHWLPQILALFVQGLMIVATEADDRYTKRIYHHKKLPHGWGRE